MAAARESPFVKPGPGTDRIQRGIVAAMCSVSSSGLFHEAVPAADAVVSHAVAMLAAFDALLRVCQRAGSRWGVGGDSHIV